MSIPRLAIHRPVTMFMLSAIITLLGFISLTRLPVDLMPEFQQPTLNIRTSYAGVGPLEMEELITRPIEQAVGFLKESKAGWILLLVQRHTQFVGRVELHPLGTATRCKTERRLK